MRGGEGESIRVGTSSRTRANTIDHPRNGGFAGFCESPAADALITALPAHVLTHFSVFRDALTLPDNSCVRAATARGSPDGFISAPSQRWIFFRVRIISVLVFLPVPTDSDRSDVNFPQRPLGSNMKRRYPWRCNRRARTEPWTTQIWGPEGNRSAADQLRPLRPRGGGMVRDLRPQTEQQFISVVHHCENEGRPSLTAEPKRMALVSRGVETLPSTQARG